jgi:ABC-2 type transport system permease protein
MGYHGMIFLFNIPLLFASNALYPLRVLPTWMQWLVLANPATYLIDALRALAFGGTATIAPAFSAAVITIFAAASTWLALVSFQKSIRRG